MTRNMSKQRVRAAVVVLGLCLGGGCGPSGQGEVGGPPPDRAAFEAGVLQFPGPTWVPVERPSNWGWSEEKLAEAWSYVEEELDTSSVMVVHRGVLIDSWGDIETRYNGQSIRKALLGALLGQEVERGRLDPQSTLADLGIDDRAQPLRPEEREARVLDLLQSRSGIYLSASYEAGSWKRRKPERGAHRPGETWYYNNWGFNALGSVFEATCGSSIHEAFAERVAEPIGMEDFRPRDVHYVRRGDVTERILGNDSEHAAYVFMVSGRDLARFGLLYLAGGQWRDRQVVPAGWVERTTTDTVATLDSLEGDRYGYLWWVSPPRAPWDRSWDTRPSRPPGGGVTGFSWSRPGAGGRPPAGHRWRGPGQPALPSLHHAPRCQRPAVPGAHEADRGRPPRFRARVSTLGATTWGRCCTIGVDATKRRSGSFGPSRDPEGSWEPAPPDPGHPLAAGERPARGRPALRGLRSSRRRRGLASTGCGFGNERSFLPRPLEYRLVEVEGPVVEVDSADVLDLDSLRKPLRRRARAVGEGQVWQDRGPSAREAEQSDHRDPQHGLLSHLEWLDRGDAPHGCLVGPIPARIRSAGRPLVPRGYTHSSFQIRWPPSGLYEQ